MRFLCSLVFAAGFFWCAHAQAGGVRLTWKDTSQIEHGFTIDRLTGSRYVTIATVGPNVESYTDVDVTPGTTYCYRVSAFNAAGVSFSSNTACATSKLEVVSVKASVSSSLSAKSSPVPPVASGPRVSSKWSDYRLSLNVRLANGGASGIIFRYQDGDNYYRFLCDSSQKVCRLERHIEGVFKTLAQSPAANVAGQTYRLEIVAQGPSIKVIMDGQTIFSIVDSTFTEGTIGLYSRHDGGGAFDDLLVEELSTGQTLLSDNFNDRDYRGWSIIDEAGESGSSRWSAISGALVARGTQSNGLGTYALFTKGSWQDYRASLKVRSADKASFGVMFRFQDSANYYQFSCESNGRRLIKRENGAPKILAKDGLGCAAGRTYTLEILAHGSSLQVNVDGMLVFSVKDASFRGGTIALHSSTSASTSYDDVLVQELPTNSVLLREDFKSVKIAGWTIFDEPGATSAVSDWKIVKGELVQGGNPASDSNSNITTFALY
jgi:hypothetical protein